MLPYYNMYDPGYYTIDNAPAGTLPDVIYAVDLHASNTIFSSNLLITGEILENGNPGTSGQVLTSGGPGLPVYWGTGGGGGASQWTGAIGSPIYYVSNVGIGSTNTPTSNLMVTGNVYVSKDVTTTNIFGNVISFDTKASNALIGNLFGNVTSFDTKASNALIGNLSGNVNSVNITASNLMVSNLITTSNIICDAFSTSSSLNFNFVTNPPPARSTSSGWQGIRQVFGDHVTGNVYVYNNKVLETTFTSLNPGFGAFVAIGGPSDNLIAVSGNGEFSVYYFN